MPDGIGKEGDKTTLVQIHLLNCLLWGGVLDYGCALCLKMGMAAMAGAKWGASIRNIILMVLMCASHSHCLPFTRNRTCPVHAWFQGKREQ
ncbi:hypothetical protein C1N53_22300 (plasmid) [Pontibacter sp. SGAir0037]|nr:hypothetical protein [Pontibacter sp. SGAir0037]QCR25255.1 hypothetical protein C1N53_22300 [Pontibacter sp. SGAir0037]